MASRCLGCGTANPEQQCPTCRSAGINPPGRFCGQECFKAHWKSHKTDVHKKFDLAKANKGWVLTTTTKGDDTQKPKPGQIITMGYRGYLLNGNTFDANENFETLIGVGQLIQGWDEGVLEMGLGEKATMLCTSDAGYGAYGYPPEIPPAATLLFDLELKSIKDAPQSHSHGHSHSHGGQPCTGHSH
eukprot:TRINITY_DN436_c0_g1_i1.p1 TRINITY_DN436_c0_g1~~TRINITY_DN436_c0_g1_i1.p1  ORF type:complete len:187 (+),score=58.00 TRINITY_DN436_c0_g1_i1:78-638(+)